MSRQSQRSIELTVAGQCELACPVCQCGTFSHARSSSDRLAAGGARATFVGGGTGRLELVGPLLAQARDRGFREVAVRTSGLSYASPEAARALFKAGATTAIVPLFSPNPGVHDRIAGRQGALVQALVGMRALAAAGLTAEIEVPLLPRRLVRTADVVELARRAVPETAAAWFRLATSALPSSIAPDRWSIAGENLRNALELCAATGVRTALRSQDAIPFCALADAPELHRTFRFDPRVARGPASGCRYLSPCERCAARGQCPGVAASYVQAHGEADIVPFESRPRTLYDQHTTSRRRWTDEQRKAASNRKLLVLRPTVNCNQDCLFCSANETSKNVWSDPAAMLRSIARAGRSGVRQLAFGGGEPTLSRDLPALISAARRCGIPAVQIVTNGVLLDTEARVAKLVDAGLTHAFVSLHAHDEALSRRLTQKAGDHARTVRAVGLLADAGVVTAVNHVVCAANFRFLRQFVEFVHARFGGRVYISFAFVTPQYKALENLELLPRLSDVIPHLKLALLRSLELGQPFGVGSRQGIPPCQLGAFQAWSDVFGLMHEAQSEDAPQKQLGPGCEQCRYGRACTGLWKPYAERYGFDELKPVQGEAPEVDSSGLVVGMRVSAWRVPTSFEDVPGLLRDRDDEEGVRALAARPASPPVAAPELAPRRSRPLRVAMIGTGRQARRIARATRAVEGVGLTAVASPHAPDGDLDDFGSCPAFRDAAECFDELRPEAAVVAASTPAHRPVVEAALLRSIPVLVEKPLASNMTDAQALIDLAERSATPVMMAHNVLFASGLDVVFARAPWPSIELARRCPPSAPDAPRAWSRSALYQTLYHQLVLVGRCAGGGVPQVVDTSYEGSARPERLRLTLAYPGAIASVAVDFAATVDDLRLAVGPSAGACTMEWRRADAAVTLTTRTGTEPCASQGSEIERMLGAFRDLVLGRDCRVPTARESFEVMHACDLALDALDAKGAPFQRPGQPKHVASPSLR